MDKEWLGEEWLPVTTACPECKVRDRLQARWGLIVNDPQGSLAGAMPKAAAHEGWWLRCTAPDCGWEGEGSHKHG